MLPSLKARHQQFIRERRYLHNVSPATVRWYTHAFKWLSLCASPEDPSQDDLNAAVCRMREKRLKATGANAAIRAINAYLHWNSKSTRKCGAGCTHPRVASLKEPSIVLPTFTVAQVNPNPMARSVPESTLCETLRHGAASRLVPVSPNVKFRTLYGTRDGRKGRSIKAGRRSFAYSALASFRTGMSGSASFQRARKQSLRQTHPFQQVAVTRIGT
jgi:hypothetical protein